MKLGVCPHCHGSAVYYIAGSLDRFGCDDCGARWHGVRNETPAAEPVGEEQA